MTSNIDGTGSHGRGGSVRSELAIAVGTVPLAIFLFLAQPGFMGGPDPLTEPSLIAGAAGVLIGLAWMVRLSRPDPEAGERSWRYRDF